MPKKVKIISSQHASPGLAREEKPRVVQQVLYVRNNGCDAAAANNYVARDNDYYDLKVEELNSNELESLYGRPRLVQTSHSQNDKSSVVRQSSYNSNVPVKKASCETNGKSLVKQQSSPSSDPDKNIISEVVPDQNGNGLVALQSSLDSVPVKNTSHEENGTSLINEQSSDSVSEKTNGEKNGIHHEPSVLSQGLVTCIVEPPQRDLRWGYYDEQDHESLKVHDWPSVYPVGIRQSPIDLTTKDPSTSSHIEYPTPLHFDYKSGDVFKVINTGTGVKFTATGTSSITGGPLGEDFFQLEQFHFHWGSDNKRGSEHFLDGKVFPAELHLVHYNSKYFNCEEALNHSDGLCVVGVFIGAQESTNKKFRPVTDVLKKVVPFEKEELFNPDGSFNPANLLPSNLEHFSFYPGSLTTPPLNESVLWVNMLEPVEIGVAQLDLFRNLTNKIGKKIVDNYRPVQELHDRKIMCQCSKEGH